MKCECCEKREAHPGPICAECAAQSASLSKGIHVAKYREDLTRAVRRAKGNKRQAVKGRLSAVEDY